MAELLAGVLDTMASSCMAICSILLIYSAYNNGHVRLVILYLTMSALVMLTSAVFLIRCVFITANAGVIYVAEMCFSLGITVLQLEYIKFTEEFFYSIPL